MDLEARIKAIEDKLTPPLDILDRVSTMKASNRLKLYLVMLKKGTQEDAVWWLIGEAEKVPALENEISMLKRRVQELEGENEKLKGGH